MESSLLQALRRLEASGCRFIVVGDLATVFYGAPGQSFEVSLVYATNPENIGILLSVLESLDAIFRIQPGRRIRPQTSHLAAGGHLNLLTSAGPLDLLGSIGNGETYQDLLAHSEEAAIDEGVTIRILDLETLIAMKEALAGEKDLAMLPVLRQTLMEKRKTDAR